MVVGIIVTDENHLANHPTPLVLDLDVNYRSPRDFHLISVEQMNPIMHAGNEEELELRRKFRPKPLYFGTFLKWSKYEMGNVQTVIYPNDYAIAHDKLFETRVHEGKTQILLTGVVSRDRRVFWTTKFPCLTIHIE
ncbi:unnamed protein product [Caenorhabditis angaria]|uniref:Uncharacterized protein n=1 Tax=Caenorhabditis angaria TaxID=860376 RepID=A0A9P1IHQ4_9PELO|nr:unnamed protein product [Caenorhabditis angaria]